MLQPGVAVFFVSKKGFLGLSRSSSSKSCERRIQAVTRTTSRGKDAATAEQEQGGPPVRSYTLGSGATLVVRPAVSSSAFAQRLEPAVHYDGEHLVCVFVSGHIENLGELAARYDCSQGGSGSGFSSPTSVLAGDPAQHAAAVICSMYQRERSGDLTVLLSELQGSFTFMLYDGATRQVFAARDSRADSAPLYYELSDDGALTLSNARVAVPADCGLTHWAELPPGHLLSGRSQRTVQQFALTPEQLSWRESYEYMEDDLSPRATTTSSAEPSKHNTLDLEDDCLVLGPADY